MEFLKDPGWLGVIIGALAIIIPVLIYWKQRNQRGITYKVISNISMIRFKEDIHDRVQVFFDDKPVSDVCLVILKIWNSGNTPIHPDEHIIPIRFDFGKNIDLLGADVLETDPGDIKDQVAASLKPDQGVLILEPLLLNRNESITLKVLLAQTLPTEKIKVNARIVGISQIKLNKGTIFSRSYARVILYISFLIFLLTVIYLILSRYENDYVIKIYYVITIIIFAAFYIMLFMVIDAINYSLNYKVSFLISIKITINRLLSLIRYMIARPYE